MRTANLEQGWYHEYKPGRVYAVQFEDGLVKIGWTANPDQRFDKLECDYRGRYCRIVREYIGPIVQKARLAEALVLLGLKPIEKKELFEIPFHVAVDRIKAICGN